MEEFKTKTAEELKELTVDELAGYYNELNVHKNAERDALIESKADQETINKLEKELTEMKGTQLKAMQAQIESMSIALKKAQSETITAESGESIYLDALKEVCQELYDKKSINKMLTDKEGKNIQLKAVDDMTIAGNTTGDIPQADRRGYSTLLERPLTVMDISNVFITDSDKVEWVYEDGEEGGAGLTVEGDTKTQSDKDWTVASVNVYKITSYVKVTKEMLKFMNNIRANIDNRLMYLIKTKVEDYLLTGAGTTEPDGVTLHAQPLDNTGLAGSIATPNTWDVAGAFISQVITEAYGPIQKGAFLMNPADVYKMVYGSRDTTNDYIYPVTVSADGVRIGGYPVIQTTAITAGYMLFGDFSKFNIPVAEGVTLSMGYDGNDFTKNKITILGETMIGSYVMQNDYNFFVYDAISDGVTFLTAAT